ncbi:MAG TPA: hypothetical protein VH913_25780 [Hyphomicrobiaceae bacterium]|jgi:hypothetical protein
MDNIDLTQFDEDGSFIIKFVGPSALLDETLVETVAGLSQSLRAIGAVVDPQYELEVYVSSIEPGSVNIVVRLKQHLKAAVLLATAVATAAATPGIHRDIIVGLFTNYVYDLVKARENCEVDIGVDKITVKGSNCRVTIRREVYDLRPRIDANPNVAEGVKRVLKAAKKDPSVKSVGVGTKLHAKPAVTMARAHFGEALRRLDWPPEERDRTIQAAMAEDARSLGDELRDQDVRANLTVIKAVLRRGKRKWQFNWQGHTISAPITDPTFFDQLESRAIALRQGDALDADLKIVQRFLPDAKVWENAAYTVTKIYGVKFGETQATMDFSMPAAGHVASTATPQLPPPLGDAGSRP